MSKFSIGGCVFLLAALSLLGYQALAAFMEQGVSNKFVFKNIRLIEIVDEKYLAWINDTITSKFLQHIADVFFTSPLFIWFIMGAVLLFLINAFKAVK
jgi:hypothetical protein